jgi:hypothetical protein
MDRYLAFQKYYFALTFSEIKEKKTLRANAEGFS